MARQTKRLEKKERTRKGMGFALLRQDVSDWRFFEFASSSVRFGVRSYSAYWKGVT